MKNYDDDRQATEGVTRTFKLAGREFTAKPTMPAKQLSAIADWELEYARIGTPPGSFDILNQAIRACLTEESRADWDALMAEDLANPITLGTLVEISQDLIQEMADRPTVPLSPSTTTDESTPTLSTVPSESEAATASA